MRILYLTQWFDPEPAFKGADFAAALAAAGHEVEVATAFPNYPGGKLYKGYHLRPFTSDNVAGIPVNRLFVYPSHDQSRIGRIANYVSFFMSALIFGMLRGRRYDAVYVYHPPITPSLAAALFCKWHQKPMVIDIQDLWPDSVTESGMSTNLLSKTLNRLCNYVYRNAAHIIVQSDGMRKKLTERGVPQKKLTRIYNWSTYKTKTSEIDDILPLELKKKFKGYINLVYGGNIGQAQALEYVIDATVEVQKLHPNLKLHIFGNGIERNKISQYIIETGSNNIIIYEPVPRDYMDRVFDMADILILHLKNSSLYELTIPSKMQHYLSVGKPIVAGLSGESAEILSESGAAHVCAPQDTSAIKNAIMDYAIKSEKDRMLIGSIGKNYYNNNLNMSHAVEKTINILMNLQNIIIHRSS